MTLSANNFGRLVEDASGGAFGRCERIGASGITRFAQRYFQRHLGQQGNLKTRCFPFAAARTKNRVTVAIIGTDEIAHVFHQAKNGDVDLGKHGGGLARVDQRDLLRGGDNDRAGERHGLQW